MSKSRYEYFFFFLCHKQNRRFDSYLLFSTQFLSNMKQITPYKSTYQEAICTQYSTGGKKQVPNFFSVHVTPAKVPANVPHANLCCMQWATMKDTILLPCQRKVYCEQSCRCILCKRKQLHKRKYYKFYSPLDTQNTEFTENHEIMVYEGL